MFFQVALARTSSIIPSKKTGGHDISHWRLFEKHILGDFSKTVQPILTWVGAKWSGRPKEKTYELFKDKNQMEGF